MNGDEMRKSADIILLTLAIALLASCGGDEGDTIIQGSEDSQARADISALESDVGNLQTRTTDLENDLSASPTSGVQIVDANDVIFGKLVDTFASSQFQAITSTGYLFYGKFTLDSWSSYGQTDNYFASSDCSGPSYSSSGVGSPALTQGKVFLSGDISGPDIYYFEPFAATTSLSAGSRYGSGGCVTTSTVYGSVVRSYLNNEAITGFPGYPTPAFRMK